MFGFKLNVNIFGILFLWFLVFFYRLLSFFLFFSTPLCFQLNHSWNRSLTSFKIENMWRIFVRNFVCAHFRVFPNVSEILVKKSEEYNFHLAFGYNSIWVEFWTCRQHINTVEWMMFNLTSNELEWIENLCSTMSIFFNEINFSKEVSKKTEFML